MATQQRNTAYKVWIGDLFKGSLSMVENRLNFIEVKSKKIVRVNVIANVIDRYKSNTKPYASLTIDDSSGQMQVKTFEDVEHLSSFEIGTTVSIIGNLRVFNGELYILPEVIQKVDDKWLLVRKLELGNPLTAPLENSIEVQSEKEMETETAEKAIITPFEKIETMKIGSNSENKTEKKADDIKTVLHNKIKEKEEGIDIDSLIMLVNFPVSEINKVVQELIEDGKIYEPQPGRLRSI